MESDIKKLKKDVDNLENKNSILLKSNNQLPRDLQAKLLLLIILS